MAEGASLFRPTLAVFIEKSIHSLRPDYLKGRITLLYPLRQ
jgi:hypothetical protein